MEPRGVGRLGQQRHVRQDAWFSPDPTSAAGSGLVATSAIGLPAGQKSYLWFQQWRLLDYEPGAFYDGGVVGINGEAASSEPWVNGPQDVLSTQYGNPGAANRPSAATASAGTPAGSTCRRGPARASRRRSTSSATPRSGSSAGSSTTSRSTRAMP